jgi:DoxX-like family
VHTATPKQRGSEAFRAFGRSAILYASPAQLISPPRPELSEKLSALSLLYNRYIRMLFITAVIAQTISAILFAWYGLNALLSESMVAEFKRYGFARFRVLTGTLQVAASIGIIVGHFYRPILLISAGGLATMMFLGLITRLKINDPLPAALPAFALCVLNIFIFVVALSVQQ